MRLSDHEPPEPKLCRGLAGRARGFLKSVDGGAGSEFALVLLPMVLIFMLILQFGLLLFVYNDMENAARDATRQMSVVDGPIYSEGATTLCTAPPAAGSIEELACNALSLWASVTTFSVTPTSIRGVADGECDQVRVEVSTPMASATIFNVFDVLTGLNLAASAVMRSQYEIRDDDGALVAGGACS